MPVEVRASMKDTYEAIMAIGFGDYEARAYCALLSCAPANGYQIAREGGIPRAKVYECIEKLVARGAAVRVESMDKDVKLFAPTDPKALVDGIEENMSAACGKAREALDRYRSDPGVVEVLWRVVSRRDLVARGMKLTREARKALHVALWAEEFDALLPDLVDAAERGVKTALILYSPHKGIEKLEKLGVGAVRHGKSKTKLVPVMGRQFALVADMERCITGSIFPDDDVEGVFTLNRGLVTNVVDLVNHEIYLERIMAEIGKPVWDVFGKDLGKLNPFDPPGKVKKKK